MWTLLEKIVDAGELMLSRFVGFDFLLTMAFYRIFIAPCYCGFCMKICCLLSQLMEVVIDLGTLYATFGGMQHVYMCFSALKLSLLTAV